MGIEAPFLKKITLQGGRELAEYPFNIPLAQKGFELSLDRPVTIICGENGSGKSTLVEAIAVHCGFSLTGGNRNHNVHKTPSDVDPLAKSMRFSWALKVTDGFFMRAESFFQFSNQIDELAKDSGGSIYGAYGGKSLHERSHGEAFMSLFENRFNRKGIYLLDEPEAALSPQRQLALLGLIRDIEKTRNAQFIIVTHSPIIMAYPGARVLGVKDGEVAEVNYKSTTHFQLMARFFANPEKYLADFLQD